MSGSLLEEALQTAVDVDAQLTAEDLTNEIAKLEAELGRTIAKLEAELGRTIAKLQAELGRIIAKLEAELGRTCIFQHPTFFSLDPHPAQLKKIWIRLLIRP